MNQAPINNTNFTSWSTTK